MADAHRQRSVAFRAKTNQPEDAAAKASGGAIGDNSSTLEPPWLDVLHKAFVCFPVAYAHRQRSVALRAKTKQPLADLRFRNYHFKNQQSSLDNHQSVAGKNVGTVPRSFAESVPNSPQRREVRQGQERGRKLLVLSNLFWKIKAQVRTHALGPLTDRSTYRFSEGARSIWFCNPITSESPGS